MVDKTNVTHRKAMQRFAVRRRKAAALRARGFSLSEIGKLLTPKVSKQAVAKLLKKEAAPE